MSTIEGDILNVKIGVCKVTLDDTDLGHTKEGVSFSYEPDIADVGVDQYGSTPIEKILTGENLQIKLQLAEQTLANMKIAIPGGSHETGAQGSRLEIGRNAGYGLSNEAYELRLHPINNEDADLSEDVVIYKAVAVEAFEVGYKVDEQRVLEVTFQALIDEAKSVGNRLGHIGVDSIS